MIELLRRFSVALLAPMLFVASPHSNAQAVDCRSCHAPGGAPGAADFSAMYDNPEIHHRIGIPFPAGAQGFTVPDGQDVDVTFFDRNHNGIPDMDEVQLFDSIAAMMVIECATCHMEHGDGPPVLLHPPKYLRFKNTGSALCTTCHTM
ncbi:MAG: hypothetical protein HZC43_11260 [Nitrosomonadales bacterium]|nr:hypothetical protein [candidate division KSB1 bacterium]MBI5660098.1 hypothetical protein [Nitrosomonadales bacterium]